MLKLQEFTHGKSKRNYSRLAALFGDGKWAETVDFQGTCGLLVCGFVGHNAALEGRIQRTESTTSRTICIHLERE
jgi:hypothetical protein